ncbi:hypothetical protein KA012_04005 [Candidatus Woesebacteria bacterium]|nr:hypothetical protein [Candidatus Woesebacteria bacterium]
MNKLRLLTSLLFASLFFAFTATSAQAADPSLSLSPSTTTTYVGQTLSVDVLLNSGGSQHTQSTFELSFDPELLQVTSNTQGPLYFNYSSNTIDNTAGTVSLTGNNFGGSTTSGKVATVSFTPIASGTNSSITFTTNTQILNQSSVPYTGLVFSPASVTANLALSSSTLSLTTEYPSWALGDQQKIKVLIDTQGNAITGTDVILKYNPLQYQYVSQEWNNLLPNQQGFNVDTINGIITVSGVTNQATPFNGSGELMNLTFKSLAVGSADFSFIWTLSSTTDTNIVDSTNPNVDLLTAQPATLTVATVSNATLSFKFALRDFLGDIASKSGTIGIASQNVSSPFSAPSSLGEVLNFPLKTLTFGQPYDILLRVPGYLAAKQNLTIVTGINPASGLTDFGSLTPGDVNQDNVNNSFDLFGIFSNWNSANSPTADLNGDGKVNTFDVALLYVYFNNTANI